MTSRNSALTLKQQLDRLTNRLHELAGWRDRARLPIRTVQFADAEGKTSTLPAGQPWPSRTFPVTMTFEATVPSEWAGQRVMLHAEPGGEALVELGGRATGGLNPFHREQLLLPRAAGGETLELRIRASPKGLFGTPERTPHLGALRLYVPDQDVQAVYEDLLSYLDGAAQLMTMNREPIAARVLDIADEAFALIPLERQDSETYLARLSWGAAERSRLNGLWDEYNFEMTDPAPYPDGWRGQLEAARELLRNAHKELLRSYPAEGRLALSGHAHIDLAWLWPLSETRQKVQRTFSTVLSLMDEYPDFTFNQSMGQLYEFVLEEAPDLFRRIQDRVKEGRWDLVGGMWVEPDGNLISGESWARQLLHGQRFFERHFGKRASVCWLPDTFGYSANLPQFLRQGEIPYFFTTKLYWSETNAFPYDLYQWEAIDGTRVLAHQFYNPAEGYNGDIKALDLAETWKSFRGKRWHDESLLSFGYGDGGGGPTRGMLERYERLKDFPGLPTLHMTRIEDFYSRVDPARLPVWVGEQYLELHRGTYTSQGRIKALNRKLEHILPEAEAACALAFKLTGAEYPRDDLYGLWKVLLRNQFHDILPGSSVKAVYDTAHHELHEALERGEALRRSALQVLSEQVSGKGEIAWNLSLTERACRGVRVPALGYARVPTEHPAPAASGLTLENEYLRVTVNQDGTLGSVWHKTERREALGTEADGRIRGNQLWAYVDVPRAWEAWDVDASYPNQGEEVLASETPRRIDEHRIEVLRTLGNSRLKQAYVLRPGMRRLDVVTRAQWTGRRTFLRSLTRANVRAMHATFESAYGAVERTTHMNTSWDAAHFESPGHRWADISEGDFGLSLLNDNKYGYSVQGDVLGLSLLRAPVYPDPAADEGEHHFTYSLFPHAGDWRGQGMTGTVGQSTDLNAPVNVISTSGSSTGQWPQTGSLLTVEAGSGIHLGALKLAEDTDELVLRLYEAHGSRGDLKVVMHGVQNWTAANFLEERMGTIQEQWAYAPFRVVTLREAPASGSAVKDMD
ncbi:glycoside hydrolase family 38 C-terminal domain-containing protein [Deinococcus deserti]|uniref:Putative Alpha-mannosidase n=1 Tax=Deinococcus deserti (strain DSM 17065 / CIP 109153 / LMG 22923 / VCD115) TaxID=546414 RepID=C1D217_DEIDV|nr:glycoside hydrolase family 38 C-terminal domain-containing protein [Deinococcus deserti]ACO47456.1 putative Alpha-mannosidase [Deinococcus deserti VCD115]